MGGFKVLLDIAQNGCHYDDRARDYMFMTSNIDGQAIKAGFEPRRIFQTHGSLHHLQCLGFCEKAQIVPFYDGYEELKIDGESLKIESEGEIPRCAECKGFMRPNVSFFSDTSDTFDDERTVAQKEGFMRWLKPFMAQRKKLLVVEIGAGKSVHSLRWEGEYLSEMGNVTMIRINPVDEVDTDTKMQKKKSRHITLKLGAKQALDAIEKCMKENSTKNGRMKTEDNDNDGEEEE